MNGVRKIFVSQSDPIDPVLLPLGDSGLLVKFGDELNTQINAKAVRVAEIFQNTPMPGVLEVSPTLISVFVRYDPLQTSFMGLCNQVRMVLAQNYKSEKIAAKSHKIEVEYGGEFGPDLTEVSARFDLAPEDFVASHNKSNLVVLAVGFAPGFIYCGLHVPELHLPRRTVLHASVPAGSIIIAAGQTAITASVVPTGWHVIGRTNFRNFKPEQSPPCEMLPGDRVAFFGELAS